MKRSQRADRQPAGEAPSQQSVVSRLFAPAGRTTRGRFSSAAIALVLLGVGLQLSWHRLQPTLQNHPRYRIAGGAINVSAAPPWIRSDICGEVVEAAGLDGELSILDEQVFRRLRDAFQAHPWVKSVVRIEKHYPPRVDIELEYRRPVAAVDTKTRAGRVLLPIDVHAVRLPEADFTVAEKQHLPRILAIDGQPTRGQVWNDLRVQGAAELANLLQESWKVLGLVDIQPSSYPEVAGDARYYTYDLETKAGTRILWGPAPGHAPSDEPTFQQKLARLKQYTSQFGPPVGVTAPARIDVRRELQVIRRQARQETADAEKR